MKISELNADNLSLTEKQLESIVFGGVSDKIVPSSVAIVLGSAPELATARAKMAANFYRNGGTRTLIVSGGVKHEFGGERISEAELMRRCLIEEGIPETDIILENRARFTTENMIFSYPEAVLRFGEDAVTSVTVITSAWHLRRSVMLAEHLLPPHVSVYGYTENIEHDMRAYKSDPALNQFVNNEVLFIGYNILRGWSKDIEF